MANLKYLIKLAFAYLIRFRQIFIVGIFIGLVAFLLIRGLFPILFRGTKEKIGMTGRYHVDELPAFILEMIGDGLTVISENGIPEPSLALSWETPDKGKTWNFQLKENILWHDDTPITSDSITYEFSDVEIVKIDKDSLSFKLKEPFSPFPAVVSKPTFRSGLLGTGEWKVDKITVVGSYVSELNLINDKKDKKIYKFFPTTETTKLAFKLGQVDKIIEVLDPSPFDSWETVTIEENPAANQVVTIFFNTQDKLLGEKSLRQALAYAIKKEGFEFRAISSVSENSWAYNPQVKDYDFDEKRAKELLEDVPKELKPELDIKLVATPVLLQTAENIARDWNALGVKTQVLVSSIVPTEFQAYITIVGIPVDPDQYPLWHSTQNATNISKYANPRIDKLLEDGRSELDTEERRKIYLDFQRFLLEDSPAVFLYHPIYYTITRK